jgi:hypothetical protein
MNLKVQTFVSFNKTGLLGRLTIADHQGAGFFVLSEVLCKQAVFAAWGNHKQICTYCGLRI